MGARPDTGKHRRRCEASATLVFVECTGDETADRIVANTRLTTIYGTRRLVENLGGRISVGPVQVARAKADTGTSKSGVVSTQVYVARDWQSM